MKSIEEATELARSIKVSGEVLAQGTVMSCGNYLLAGLVLRSALAEIEFNIKKHGLNWSAYEKVKGVLEETMEKAEARELSGAEANAQGGSA